MPDLAAALRLAGGPGLFDVPVSTSNLHAPAPERVLEYSRPITDPATRATPGLVTALLERRLREYHDAAHCVALSSGFWALVLAIARAALPGRDRVLIPSLTYRRLADVVHWAGRTPVFVDLEPDGLAVSLADTRAKVDERTGLLLAVHPIVGCCDVPGFMALAEETGVPVVFDAVESVHETLGGRRIGSFGPPEVFSLHASKLVNGFEGGYVCTGDADFAAALRAARDQGLVRPGPDAPWPGLNARMCDGHAAFTLAELDALDGNVRHNEAIYRAYDAALAGVAGVRLVRFDESDRTSFKNIVVEVDGGYPLSRDRLVQVLNGERVLARAHYDPPLHLKPHKFEFVAEGLARSEEARSRFLNLPCGARVSVGDVQKVCALIDLLGRSPALAGAAR